MERERGRERDYGGPWGRREKKDKEVRKRVAVSGERVSSIMAFKFDF